MTESRIFLILQKLQEYLTSQTLRGFLVGGFVRDSLLQRSTADIDLAITGDALQLGPRIAAVLEAKFVPLDTINHVCRIVLNESQSPASTPPIYLDLSTIEANLTADLARRDFSVDALAVDLKDYLAQPEPFERLPVIDLQHGLADLRSGVIEVLNTEVFRSDPARLLRANRLAAELGFTLSRTTEALISRDKNEIRRIAGERTHEELLKLLATSQAGRVVRRMDEQGLLTVIFPELEAARNVEQPKEHHWDVLNHSLESVSAAGCILRQGTCQFISPSILDEIPWSPALAEHFNRPLAVNVSHAGLIKLAALLHDIAKPETKILDKERVRFFGHNEQGADRVVTILERLRFSNREIRLVENMVRNHMRPTQMSHEGMPTRRAIYRYYRDTGVAATDILFLSLADHLAARGPDLDLEQWRWHLEQVKYILNESSKNTTIMKVPHLINGHDLINVFGLTAGPQLRELLESVREAQAAGEVTNRSEALSYIENRLIYKKQN
jgi:poly(A) polymerase